MLRLSACAASSLRHLHQCRPTSVIRTTTTIASHYHRCFASSSSASSSRNIIDASTASSSPTPRLTYMQEQTAIHDAALLATAERKAAAIAASSPSLPVDDSVPPPIVSICSVPPRSLLSNRFVTSPSSVSSALPVARSLPVALSPISLLVSSGLVKLSADGDSIVVLPSGARTLSKIERLLAAELSEFNAQEVRIGEAAKDDMKGKRKGKETNVKSTNDNDELASTSSTSSTPTPYPASFAHSLPLITSLIIDDFRSRRLDSSSLSCTHNHSASVMSAHSSSSSSSSSRLWPGSKPSSDVFLFDSSHTSGIKRYNSLVDAFVRSLSALALRAISVESDASTGGIGGVDADLAHEIHVLDDGANNRNVTLGASTILHCTHCSYAATPARAMSRSSASFEPSDAWTPDLFPPSLHKFTTDFIRSEIKRTYSPHVMQQLKMNDVDKDWKVEFVYEKDAKNQLDGASEKILYMILLRRDHELNLSSLCEHLSTTHLHRVSTIDEGFDIMRRILSADADASALLHAAYPEGDSSSLELLKRDFDRRPEILIDQALIPDDVDLDMERIDESQYTDQQQEDENEAIADDELISSLDADVEASSSSDSSFASTMENSFISTTSKLHSGESIDLVALEASSRGLDPSREVARLKREAQLAQQSTHEELERQHREEREMEGEQKRSDEDETSPTFNPSQLQPSTSSSSVAPSSAVTKFSALIPHFEYSKQGFFRSANPGESCAICDEGTLDSSRSHVLANTAFVGRQEIVAAADGEVEGEEGKAQYLHTSMGRMSTHDALMVLSQRHYFVPPVSSRPTSSAAPAAPSTLVPTVFYPSLLAPYQVILLPVLVDTTPLPPPSAQRGAMRDAQKLRATKALTSKEKAKVIKAAEGLYDQLRGMIDEVDAENNGTTLLASTTKLSPEYASPLDAPFYSLTDELLIDDNYSAATLVRVNASLSTGSPLLLLLSSSGLANGCVSLILNKRGVATQPRRVKLDAVVELVRRMIRSNYANILRDKQMKIERKREEEREEEMRMKDAGREQEEDEEMDDEDEYDEEQESDDALRT